MTLRPILLFFAALSFLGALLLWRSEPPQLAKIFGSRKSVELQGHAETYTAPRGSMRVRIRTTTGTVYFTDCLAIMQVCSASQGAQLPVVAQAVLTSPRVFWPLSVTSRGTVLVSTEASARAYQVFVEREESLYRLPLYLGIAFLVFAVWFGRRPAMP